MYGIDTYADGTYGDTGAPAPPSTLLVDSFVEEVLGNSTATADIDSFAREVLGNAVGTVFVDSVSREVLARGPGTIHADSVVREIVAGSRGFIHVDSFVREILCIPLTAIYVDSFVREILAPGPHAYFDTVGDGGADPRDILSGANNYAYTLTETADATDTLRVVPARRKTLVYDPLPQSHPDPAVRQIQEKVNAVLQGRVNTSFVQVTLDANSDTTTLVDARLGPDSNITLTPLSASAATEQYWIERQRGQAIIHHSNSADTTRSFNVNIVA